MIKVRINMHFIGPAISQLLINIDNKSVKK